ncbi:MAG: hypothetical protein ACOCV4_05565 [Myxococcota bacterium]
MAAALAALASMLACGSDDDAGSVVLPPDAGTGADGAADPDAGVPAAPGLAAEPGGLPPDEGFEAGGGDRAACYDGLDNDDDGAVDCGDTTCHALRSCCIGAGDCCAPADPPSLPGSVDFTSCDPASDLDACLASQSATGVAFGEPSPVIGSRGLAPGGDASFDSGVVLGDPVDLRSHRLDLEAQLEPAMGCGDSCLEGLGMALTTRTTFDDTTTVDPVAGLLYSGSRGEVTFVVAGSEVGRAPFPADGVVRLVVEPTGVVRAYVGADASEPAMEATAVPPAAAHLVLYGRNRDVEDAASAHVASLEVNESGCDMPSAWSSRSAITVVDPDTGTDAALAQVRSPSLAYDDAEGARLAFEERRSDGSVIRWASRRDGEEATFDLLDDAAAPALAPGDEVDAAGVGAPELLWNPASSRWVLFYAATDDGGNRHIGRAEAGAGDAAFVPDEAPVLEASDVGVGERLEGVTVARRADGVWAMIVAASLPDGTPSWHVRRSSDTDGGANPVPVEGTSPFAPHTVAGAEDPEADGEAPPSLALHGGAWRLFYGGTRGTRPFIAALASDELVYHRHLNAGAAVLDASGAGFDRLGVTAPDAVARGDAIELVYLGFDGVRHTLGWARRHAPGDATFPE